MPGREFRYCYAALTDATALAETLLRSLKFRDDGARLLPRAQILDRRLITLDVIVDLRLVSLLSGPALAAVCQDGWLVHAGPSEHCRTRPWGHWLRDHAQDADGIIWPSKQDVAGRALILFGDRAHCAAAVVPGAAPPRVLDDADGANWLNARLAGYRVKVLTPRTTG